MIVGKVLRAGTVEVDGEDLVGVFVECCREDLRDYVGNLVYRTVEIRPMVAPANTCRRIVGEPWIEVAASRMRAGEPEVDVMRDYGYTNKVARRVEL